VAPRLAVNLDVRNAYTEDCQAAVDKWNRLVADLGVEFRLPSPRFRRSVGTFAAGCFDPDGCPITEEEFRRRVAEWLPSAADEGHVRSLMAHPVTEPGRFANWIAPPARGIDGRPVDFEYVRSNEA
jgi:benzoyl-CoA 2,3-dioxygenase component B